MRREFKATEGLRYIFQGRHNENYGSTRKSQRLGLKRRAEGKRSGRKCHYDVNVLK